MIFFFAFYDLVNKVCSRNIFMTKSMIKIAYVSTLQKNKTESLVRNQKLWRPKCSQNIVSDWFGSNHHFHSIGIGKHCPLGHCSWIKLSSKVAQTHCKQLRDTVFCNASTTTSGLRQHYVVGGRNTFLLCDYDYTLCMSNETEILPKDAI